MPESRSQVLAVIRQKGLRHLPEPVVLSSGALSRDFVDGKEALADGADLETACRALVELARASGVEFDAVGGLTMGADQFAHVIAVVARCGWFVVRKQPKGRGTNKRIEGTALGPGVRVLLVDDVVTTGGSIRDAYEVVTATGATVVAAMTLVDRGDLAAGFFVQRSVPFLPLFTYRDLGIEPVGDGLVSA